MFLISFLALFLNLTYAFKLNWLFFSQESNLVEVKQMLREAPLEDSKKKELSSALHVYFKDWLYCNMIFPFFIKTDDYAGKEDYLI